MYNIQEIDEWIDTIKIDKSKHTLTMYQSALNKLFEYNKIKSFDDIKKITSSDIRNFQKYLKESGLQESSVNSNIRPIRSMFNWLVYNEYLEKSPMIKIKDLKCAKKEREFLSEDEQEKIILSCDKIQDRLILALLITTGIRRDELCRLSLKDFDGTHILVHGKGKKERSLRLQDDVIQLMNLYIEHRNKKFGDGTDALVVSSYGNHYTGNAIYKKIKTVMKKAGLPEDRIEKIHPHSCRHSFVANMLDGGADIFVVSNALGHSKLEITSNIYGHIHSKTMDRAMMNQKSIFKKEN